MNTTVVDLPQQPRLLNSVFRNPSFLADNLTSDGVVDSLQGESVAYEPWLDISSRDALRDSLRQGVSCALAKHAVRPSATRYVGQNIYDLRRASWQVLCPLSRDSVVIDFGCGLGAISRSIGRNVGSVIGIDACYERLMINAAVNRELGHDNIGLVFGNHQTLSDIQSASVDGFVLNGVLEWVAEQIPGDPYRVQVDFLRECRRVLKPDGWLYLGIENRWGFRYFLGRPDDHTQMLFSSLLPRWMATVYSRITRGKPYRTYTYGPRATQQLLRVAGFAHADVYSPLPDYREFAAIFPFGARPSSAAVAKRLGISKSWKRSVVESRAFCERFVPCLSLVGRNAEGRRAAWLADLCEPEMRVRNIYVKYDQASIWYRAPNEPTRVREVALSSEAAEKLCRIRQLSESLRNSEWRPLALREWTLTRQDGFVWADRPLVVGRTLNEMTSLEQEDCLASVFAQLRQTHQAAESLAWDAKSLSELFWENAPNAERDLPDSLLNRIRSLIGSLEQTCERRRILMHGDCKAANIVIADAKAHLIDWEWSRVVQHIGYDVLKFAWSENEDPRGADFQTDETVVQKALDDSTARRFFDEVHPGCDWKSAVLVYWANRLSRTIGLYRYGGAPLDWHDRVVHPWTESMCQVAGI